MCEVVVCERGLFVWKNWKCLKHFAMIPALAHPLKPVPTWQRRFLSNEKLRHLTVLKTSGDSDARTPRAQALPPPNSYYLLNIFATI